MVYSSKYGTWITMQHSHKEYIWGYFVGLTLAIGATANVATFLIETILPPLAITLCCLACFILNLILYWQSFPDILHTFKSLQHPTTDLKTKILPLVLAVLACSVLHIFTYNSFIVLKEFSNILGALLPTPIVHLLTIMTSIGNLGLYIEDAKTIINELLHGKNPLIPFEQILSSLILVVIPILFPQLNPALMTSIACLAIWHLYDFLGLCRIIAVTATINLCISYFDAFSIAYNITQIVWLQYLISFLAAMSLLSLFICDSSYGIGVMTKRSETKTNINNTYYILLVLAFLNAVANAAISSHSALFNTPSIIGGIISFFTMKSSIQTLYSDEYQSTPPFYQSILNPCIIFVLNILLLNMGQLWLSYTSRLALHQFMAYLRNNYIVGISYQTLSTLGFYGLNCCLFIPKANIQKPKGQQLYHQEDSPQPLKHDDPSMKLAMA